jgi:drug/metabolite transporter (DMT)-like permease
LLYCLLALFGITAGSLWQKRFLPAFDLRTGTCIQYAASLFVLVPLAIVFDRRPVVWHPEMIGALLWSVFGLSIGAIFLMFLLIRRGEATRIASLFYLVPPTTAWMAWVLFDEGFGMVAALGMLVTALGVWLVQTNRAQPS